MKHYTFPYKIIHSGIEQGNLSERLSELTGYLGFTKGNRIIENGRPVLDENGLPQTTDPWIVINGTDNLIEADVKAVLDKFEADFPDYEAEKLAEWNALEYARIRKKQYPSIPECVHAILDGELDALQEKRQAVKLKYPKEQA